MPFKFNVRRSLGAGVIPGGGTPPPAPSYLVREDGSYILREDGSRILREAQ